MSKKFIGAIAGIAALLGAPLHAEVLPVEGIYPADDDSAITMESIAVEPLKGSQGPSFGIALKDRLEGVEINGAPWFAIVEPDDAAMQAVLSGSVSHEIVEDTLADKEVKSCLEKDSNDNCVRHRTTFIPCRSKTVQLLPDIRMHDAADNELFKYSVCSFTREEYCEDESSTPEASAMLSGLKSDVARYIRYDLAPFERSREIRILERRKGMEKADRRPFKDAVRMTKHDPLAACLAFEALEANNAEQASVLFNIGVCKEGEGALDAAEGYYMRTIAILGEKSYTSEALERIGERRKAVEQLDRRAAAQEPLETVPAPASSDALISGS